MQIFSFKPDDARRIRPLLREYHIPYTPKSRLSIGIQSTFVPATLTLMKNNGIEESVEDESIFFTLNNGTMLNIKEARKQVISRTRWLRTIVGDQRIPLINDLFLDAKWLRWRSGQTVASLSKDVGSEVLSRFKEASVS